MSLSGLPPLPNALSALEILQQQMMAKQQDHVQSLTSLTSSSSSSMSRKNTSLDVKLAILKSEMVISATSINFDLILIW
jgi:hypothetical protein